MSTIKTDNIVNRTGDQDSGLDLGTNDIVKVKIAGSEKARVHSDGSLRVDAINNQSGDNDSGIDLATNDVVKVKIAGSEKARVDASGNLVIGATSASAKLDVKVDSSTAYSSSGEPREDALIRNSNGTDDSGVNNYVSLGLHVADGATSQGFINYMRTGNSTGAFTLLQRNGSSSYEEQLRVNSGGGLRLNGNYNIHVRGGAAAPDSAFQFDFHRGTYAHPIKVSCAISHWNGGYMSYTEGWYWGFNTSMSSGNVTSYNGGNGSWTISFPTNNLLRVRMNGDASYSHSSGWYIKVEGNLRVAST